MKPQNIADRLVVLGLTKDEAALYVRLHMLGSAKASDLAAECGIRRSEVYRTLQNLVQRGYVSATLSRPTQFEAAPPERLFEQVFAQYETAWETVAREKPELMAGFAALRGAGATERASKNTFKLLQGRLEGLRAAEELLRGAQRSVRVLATGPGASLGDVPDFWDLALRRAHDGLRVEALLPAMPGPLARADAPTAGFEVRKPKLDRAVQCLLIDDAEVLTWLVTEPTTRRNAQSDVVVHSDAPGFVDAYVSLFELAWPRAGALAVEVRPVNGSKVGAA